MLGKPEHKIKIGFSFAALGFWKLWSVGILLSLLLFVTVRRILEAGLGIHAPQRIKLLWYSDGLVLLATTAALVGTLSKTTVRKFVCAKDIV